MNTNFDDDVCIEAFTCTWCGKRIEKSQNNFLLWWPVSWWYLPVSRPFCCKEHRNLWIDKELADDSLRRRIYVLTGRLGPVENVLSPTYNLYKTVVMAVPDDVARVLIFLRTTIGDGQYTYNEAMQREFLLAIAARYGIETNDD